MIMINDLLKDFTATARIFRFVNYNQSKIKNKLNPFSNIYIKNPHN